MTHPVAYFLTLCRTLRTRRTSFTLPMGSENGNAIIVLMNGTPDLETDDAMDRLFDRIDSDLLNK